MSERKGIIFALIGYFTLDSVAFNSAKVNWQSDTEREYYLE
jgi:hypothetical protein